MAFERTKYTVRGEVNDLTMDEIVAKIETGMANGHRVMVNGETIDDEDDLREALDPDVENTITFQKTETGN